MISHTQNHLKSLGHYQIHYFMELDFMIPHTQLSSQITLSLSDTLFYGVRFYDMPHSVIISDHYAQGL